MSATGVGANGSAGARASATGWRRAAGIMASAPVATGGSSGVGATSGPAGGRIDLSTETVVTDFQAVGGAVDGW